MNYELGVVLAYVGEYLDEHDHHKQTSGTMPGARNHKTPTQTRFQYLSEKIEKEKRKYQGRAIQRMREDSPPSSVRRGGRDHHHITNEIIRY